MTRLSSLMTVAAALAVVVFVSMPVLAQQPEQRPPAQAPAAQAAKVFEGELAKVDATAKTLSVKGTGGAEMIFAYTDATLVTGPDKTVQGLASKSGSPLKITYTDLGATHMATRIEMVEKK